ncbi:MULTISPECIES: aspartyl protease family protein [unclassified Tenacibaculum]|uniref:aspartyl protease family protein n=1 Tax=unclassified Tenacibaculum TaxID=2635139 RepID=UPI001F36E7AF|nr:MULTISPECIES: aspartyl protease family protein [unclassified Tenacibaculum]MCF2875041.1 aspartyl protease family protein [Tenacibaculum sp. Cn5-1]MCF2935117.1 aspartyl protease family protein [Tenacibaculum sp. Cn5-34]MCG7511441.1 aspartyl protease family protein [Tenacibaculum sp. Cn5-46]
MKKRLLYIITFFLCLSIYSQKKFRFLGKKTDKQELTFRLINNLIVIPLEINGNKLSFILDTGVNKTILFNLTKNDSIGLNNIEKVFIRGLGDGEPIEALLSKGNNFRVKNISGSNQELYVILKDAFNLSAKMGVTIHGIIGYDLLKDVIVRVNYSSKRIVFYNPQKYKKSKCRKCEVFPLQFYRNKPYIDVKARIDTINNVETPLKLLVDTGGSDAMWLFEDTKEIIKTPIKHFEDIMGEGISGTIYGNRSKIPHVSIGRFKLKEPTVSFLDSTSTFNARQFKQRNGSIGGNILKRFKVWIDYPNKTITLKKNASLRDGFYYNMSGIHVIYDGQELIREKAVTRLLDSRSEGIQNTNNIISFVNTYHYRFKPKYKIDKIVEGSPADKAGIKVNDIILNINNKPAHQFSLEEIISLFQTKPNRKIRMKIKRGIEDFKFEFRLEKRI